MKKLLKRYLSLLLAILLVGSVLPLTAFAEETEEMDEIDEMEDEEIVYPDELIVGNPTITKGDFFTEMFGNDTADIDVRALIHGYNLVNWDQNQGVYVIDESVVENLLVTTDSEGNKTYYLGLYDDLYYSDGTLITAWDYAFSILLMMSHEIEEIGGKIYRSEHILGSREYLQGALPYLTGVAVLDEHQLAITLDHEFLPYFFEIGLLLCVPYPISEIAPGCKVYAGGEVDLGDGYGYGIWIGNEDPEIQEPVFTAELLQKTILDPETGYNSHPSVVSGPYRLVSWDGVTGHFEANEYYKGAWLGNTLPEGFRYEVKEAGSGTPETDSHTGPNIYKEVIVTKDGNTKTIYLAKPAIRRIAYTVADNDTLAQDLAEGKIHLANKVMYGPTVFACLGRGTTQSTADEEEDWAEEDEEDPDEYLDEDLDEDLDEEDDEDPDEEEDGEEEPETDTAAEIQFQNYPRIGLSFLTFTYENPTVHEMEVRQAMAWCMDREQLTRDYCSGNGMVVNGYYGIEQWEYKIIRGLLEYPLVYAEDEELTPEEIENLKQHPNRYAETEEEYEQMQELWGQLNLDNLTNYNVYDVANDPERTEKVGVQKANELLDKAEWTLNRNGETYQPGVDDVRCKMIDGELVALDLTLMYPRGNHIADTIQENFLDNLTEAGIRVTLVPEDMEELLNSYYREKERTTDMIYLGTDFHVIVDPSITYSADPTPDHLIWNNTYSDDEELWELAVDMRKTVPENFYEYVVKWIRFQERYNEVLPAIPLYSNVYFDFYISQLQNYQITAHVTWSQAILQSYFGEVAQEPEEDEELSDDAMIFDD